MGIGNHRRQQTSNIKRISTKSFSHNRKSQILRSKKQSLSENYSPKATHPMTNLAPSERLHKQFCQTHISTINRPERRQRWTQATNGHLTRGSHKWNQHFLHTKHYRRAWSVCSPGVICWRRQCHEQTTPIDRIDRPKNIAIIDNFDEKTEKRLEPVTNF